MHCVSVLEKRRRHRLGGQTLCVSAKQEAWTGGEVSPQRCGAVIRILKDDKRLFKSGMMPLWEHATSDLMYFLFN